MWPLLAILIVSMKNCEPATTVFCDCVTDWLLKAEWLETTSIRSLLPGSECWEVAEFSGNSEGDGKAWVEEICVTYMKSQGIVTKGSHTWTTRFKSWCNQFCLSCPCVLLQPISCPHSTPLFQSPSIPELCHRQAPLIVIAWSRFIIFFFLSWTVHTHHIMLDVFWNFPFPSTTCLWKSTSFLHLVSVPLSLLLH